MNSHPSSGSPALSADTEGYEPALVEALEEVQRRVLWLAINIVHVANSIRPNPSGVKVGGHQASCASAVTILTTLYFDFLRPR